MKSQATSTVLLQFYRSATSVLSPIIAFYVYARTLRGKEDKTRLRERFGYPAFPRPNGVLVWAHAASVGEMMSCLHLLKALITKRPDITILLTTGTVTSARLAPAKLSEGIVHHYMPIDTPKAVKRFQSHFRFDLALWMESELWPNHLRMLAHNATPCLLINARMSERSSRRWSWFSASIKTLLSTFIAIYAGSDGDAARFARLGAPSIHMAGNIKYDAPALQADASVLNDLTQLFFQRPIWIAASTHAGEETIILDAHKIITHSIPNLLTIITPRHAKRGESVARLVASQHLKYARRSAQDSITPDTAIYIADTMGELGNFFRLCDIVFVGGSLVARGGHNPIEPARLNCALITGPHIHHFTDIYSHFTSHLAIEIVKDAASLANAVTNLMLSIELRNERAQAASAVVSAHAGATRKLLKHALQLLPKPLV